MAKPKLILTANPTFKSRVDIPVPGGRPVSVEFTYRHRDADAYKEFVDTIAGRDEIDVIMDISSGWELDDAFDRDNVELLCKQYMGAGRAIFDKYIEENTGAKAGN